MKNRLSFIGGLAAALGSIALVVHAVAQLQAGPTWEVPASAATKLLIFSCLAIGLDGIAIVLYFAAGRFRQQQPFLWLAFAFLVALGTVVVLISLFAQPSQWPIQHSRLSGIIRDASTPIALACAILWFLLSTAAWVTAPDRVDH